MMQKRLKYLDDNHIKRDEVSEAVLHHLPVLCIRGESARQRYLRSADKLFSELVSKTRQAIESFFNWLNEKTAIQSASKVHSSTGLIAFIFARIALAAL